MKIRHLWMRGLRAAEASVAAGIIGISVVLSSFILSILLPEQVVYENSFLLLGFVLFGVLGTFVVGVLAALIGFRSQPRLSALGLVLTVSVCSYANFGLAERPRPASWPNNAMSRTESSEGRFEVEGVSFSPLASVGYLNRWAE